MLDDFLIRAIIAGIGVAIAAAPLGCFVIWRRMAYFGDATAHAALLGVAFALATSLPISFGVLVVALAMGTLIVKTGRTGLAVDTRLGVFSHAALAFGLVAISLANYRSLDLEGLLFGDILAVSRGDIALIWIGAIFVIGLLTVYWDALFAITLNIDLARASGIKAERTEMVLIIALAIIVSIAIKIVGALLITAMILIPPAAARPLSKTPEHMAVIAAIMGALSVLLGMEFALYFDTPAGPSIVCAATAMFVLSYALSRVLRISY